MVAELGYWLAFGALLIFGCAVWLAVDAPSREVDRYIRWLWWAMVLGLVAILMLVIN